MSHTKDAIKRFAAEHAVLEKSMFLFYKLKNGAAANKAMAARKHLSIFDVQALSADLPYGPEERVIDNNLYGYAHHLKKYAGITHDLRAYMEHGLFLGGIVHTDQRHWHFTRIVTMSKMRQAEIAKHLPHKETIAVGPYIHYAEELLEPQAFAELKKQLGRVLLVYPFHSMKNVNAQYDLQAFIAEINRLKNGYDTVLISLYYVDVSNKKLMDAYQSQGFRVVTAGHKFDRNFVARQKLHIQLADMTMSNSLGTQTGYCVYLNKPHYIFKQSLNQKASNEVEHNRFSGISNLTEKEVIAWQKDLFANLFNVPEEILTAEQRQTTSEFWGFADIKTAAELKALFG